MKRGIFTLLFAALFILSGTQTVKAQETMSKNAFFVELGGNGLIFSANYDRRLSGNFGAKVGLGYLGGSGNSSGILTIPVQGNFLLGKNGKYFEIGLGATYVGGTGELFDDKLSSVVGTASFMYRYQPINSGVMWKIGITPILAEGVFFPYWLGLGIGYCW